MASIRSWELAQVVSLRYHSAVYFVALLIALHAQSDVARVSGVVLNDQGAPIPGARVFFERSLGAPLEETRAAADGRFIFGAISPTDRAGVFAIAPGYAIGGASVRVSIGDRVDDLSIRLGKPATITGKVVDVSGRAIPGARISGWAIPADKIGIPLAQLASYGIRGPVTDGDGAFTLEHVPANSTIDVKFVHPEFAQSGVMGIRTGSSGVEVVMDPGTLVRGHVRLSGSDRPVTSAPVFISRAQPPFDTVITLTGVDGGFTARLLPGPYMCEVRGGAYRSPTPQRFSVTGQVFTQTLALYAAATGELSGTVKNAETGAPVEGARLRVEALGSPVSVSETGPSGEFRFEVAEGNATLRLLSAPGHYDPQGRALTFPVASGGVVEHTFWVVNTPGTRVRIVDTSDLAVSGAALRLLRPQQFGWHFSDATGMVAFEVGVLPPDNILIGLAEDPVRGTAGLFALDGTSAEATPVELGAFAIVRGRVVNADGKAVPGAVVNCVFADPSLPARPVMWQTLSRGDGTFVWEAVPPQVPLVCTAQADTSSGAVAGGTPVSFIVDPNQIKDIGAIAIPDALPGASLFGTPLDIGQYPLQCGPAVPVGPKIVAFVGEAEAPYALETWNALRQNTSISVVVVLNGTAACPGDGLTVLRGAAPGLATTYVIDAGGQVALETFGLPPLTAIAKLNP